jgi:hypothetical protein
MSLGFFLACVRTHKHKKILRGYDYHITRNEERRVFFFWLIERERERERHSMYACEFIFQTYSVGNGALQL